MNRSFTKDDQVKEREDKDREDYVEDQEIKLENKEEQLNQLMKNTKAKENETVFYLLIESLKRTRRRYRI